MVPLITPTRFPPKVPALCKHFRWKPTQMAGGLGYFRIILHEPSGYCSLSPLHFTVSIQRVFQWKISQFPLNLSVGLSSFSALAWSSSCLRWRCSLRVWRWSLLLLLCFERTGGHHVGNALTEMALLRLRGQLTLFGMMARCSAVVASVKRVKLHQPCKII